MTEHLKMIYRYLLDDSLQELLDDLAYARQHGEDDMTRTITEILCNHQ